MNLFLLIVVNLVTGVGGHFVNKRWDRAILLFGAFVLIMILIPVFSIYAVMHIDDPGLLEDLPKIFLGVVVAFYVVSPVLFLRDYRKQTLSATAPWTRATKTAVVIFCLGSTAVLASFSLPYLFASGVSDFKDSEVSVDKENGSTFRSYRYENQFSDYIYFSFGRGDLTRTLPEPPEGDAIMFGTILQDGNPVPGVKLDVALDGRYKVASLISDNEGKFSFSVAEGNWRISAIFIHEWADKPDGEYLVVTGGEDPAGQSHYHKSRYDAGEVEVIAETGVANEFITLEITPAIEVRSPAENEREIVDNPAGFTVEWDPHDGAELYLIGLSVVTERGTTTNYSPVHQIRTSGTSVLLSEFPILEDPGSTNIYDVSVAAFDGDGRFLSESTGLGRFEFQLEGRAIAEQSIVNELGPELDDGNYLEFFENERKIRAAELLLENDLVAEAEKVLDLITANSRAGKIDALKGYILAKKGNCEDAHVYFDKALSEGGSGCVPAKYRSGCL